MYGLVNQGIRKMVTESFGADTWKAIMEKSGIDDEIFIAMDPYPDSITFTLVGSASSVLELPVPDLLKAFGHWWIGNAAKEYGSLFTMTGSSFMEFMTNLNDIHTRVGYMLTQLTPPSFKVIPKNETTLEVHYHSQREGLYPMVQGMIEGIGDWFDTKIDVEHIESTDKHDTFIVHLTEGA